MLKIFDLFKKQTQDTDASTTTSSALGSSKTWFEERYEMALTQRNWMFFMASLCIIAVGLSVLAVTKISLSKEFDPFVIQIEDTSGLAKVVNPISSEALSGNEALARYFIKKYVVARETYNPIDFETRAHKIVRLLSTPPIYNFYIGYIKNKNNDPSIFYGQKNTTYLAVKSWSKLDLKRYVFRFSINETVGDRRTINKIAIVDIDYVPMSLTEDERDINPVGFQVTGYRVDDDNS